MVERLKFLREREKITQAELAAAIGVTQQAINKYENQATEPDYDTLKKLSAFFETSVDFLIGNTDIDHKIEEIHDYSLNNTELTFLESYRTLNEEQRRLLVKTASVLSESK